jgi:lipopolysaccharide biosynthesis glycosyltransferase
MSEPIPVVVACDSNFLLGLQTTLASVILHEKSNTLSIHVLDGGLFDRQWESLVSTVARLNPHTRLTRHRLGQSILANFSVKKEWTVMAYARILAPMFVPDPFAVYIDSDFLVSKPISELLPYLNSGKAICASPDTTCDWKTECPWGESDPNLSKYTYVNSGLLLLNLEKWRRDGIAEHLFSFLEKESAKIKFPDQSAINWLLKDDIEYIPVTWNTIAHDYDFDANKAHPGEINLHFCTGMKPWKRPLPRLSHHIWWLFNEIFPPTSRPPNPLWRPRNLVRYARYWVRNHREGIPESLGSPGSIKAWGEYWKNLRMTLPPLK